MFKLPPLQDEALRIIAEKRNELMNGQVINALLDKGFITFDVVNGGWRVNSKGREYIKKHKS